MEFEFDKQKSRSNKEKHGIDFVEAQALWHDISRVEIPARTKDEPRMLVVGTINIGQQSLLIEALKPESSRSDDPGRKRCRCMKAKEFDEKFEKDENVISYLDLSKARRPDQEQRRVNVDFPNWMIHSLDKEAKKLGVTRQSIIKVWIYERLKVKTA